MIMQLKRIGRSYFYVSGKMSDKIVLNTAEKYENGRLFGKVEEFDSIEDLEIFIAENPERIIDHIAIFK